TSLIADTLTKTGARPFARERGSPKLSTDLPKVDLAVWVDEFEGNLGNPVVIDIKRHLSDRSIPITTRQISNYLRLTGASVGLIVYLHEAKNIERFELLRFAGRRVQWISASKLF